MKLSETELIIPNLQDIELSLIDNKIEIVKEGIKAIISDKDKIKAFNEYILKLLDQNKSRVIPLFNITSSLLESLNSLSFELNRRLYCRVGEFLIDKNNLGSKLFNYNPFILFNELLGKLNSDKRKSIISLCFDLIDEKSKEKEDKEILEEDAYNFIKEAIKHKHWLDDHQKKKMGNVIREHFYYSIKILSLFIDKEEEQTEFLNENILEKFISNISYEDVENIQSFEKKSELIINFKKIITSDLMEVLFNKLTELLEKENKQVFRDKKKRFLINMENIIVNLEEKMEKIENRSCIVSYSENFLEAANLASGWEEKKYFIFIGIILLDELDDGPRQNIMSLIKDFYANTDIDSFKDVFDKFNKGYQRDLMNINEPVLTRRILQDEEFFYYLYPLASKEVQKEWFSKLISERTQFSIDMLKKWNFKIKYKNSVVSKLLEVAPSSDMKIRKEIYNAINNLKCANDSNLRDKFADQIKKLIMNQNNDHQSLGYNILNEAKHLSKSLRREVSRDIIEWLRQLQPQAAGQQYALGSIMLDWEILPNPVKENYIDFVYDKLIYRGTSQENIELGFQLLLNIGNEINKYPTYIDDLLDRMKRESNPQKKNIFRSGLLNLKPYLKRKKKFWDEVEKG